MFLDCAMSAGGQFGAEDAALLAMICRRLDGLPMAIEIVAAHVGMLGLAGVAGQIGTYFTLAAKGRRTALPRHLTLRATLDWSCGLLTPEERRALQALSIFPAHFNLNGAAAVIGPDAAPPAAIAGILGELVSKSLVSLREEGGTRRYRLLDTTRDYAWAALSADGTAARVAARHARFCLLTAEQAERDADVLPAAAWFEAYGALLDDARAALVWCFSPKGDRALGVALTGASIQIWTRHAILEEHGLIIERALAALPGLELVDSPLELKLLLARGSILYHSSGAAMDARTHDAFRRALDLAKSTGNAADKVRALSGLFAHGISRGNYMATHALATEFEQTASGTAGHIARRSIAHNLLYMGRLQEAQAVLAPAIAYGIAAPAASGSGVHYAHAVVIDTVRARLAWLAGRSREALHIATQAVEAAAAATPPISLCLTLSTGAVFVASMIQDQALIERFLSLLEHHTTRHSMERWGEYAAGYRLACVPRSQRTQAEAERFAAFVEGLNGALLESLAVLGEAHATPELVQRALRGEAGWCRAELLRHEAMYRLSEGSLSIADAEHALLSALEIARAQGARAWELRIATDLAGLWGRTGRQEHGLAMLRPLVDSFDQSLRCPALAAASGVLKCLGARV
jgi:predicted ATPase